MKKVYVIRDTRFNAFVAGPSETTENVQAAQVFTNKRAAQGAVKAWRSTMEYLDWNPVEIVPVWDSHGLIL